VSVLLPGNTRQFPLHTAAATRPRTRAGTGFEPVLQLRFAFQMLASAPPPGMSRSPGNTRILFSFPESNRIFHAIF
jgi:hypothetical protein